MMRLRKQTPAQIHGPLSLQNRVSLSELNSGDAPFGSLELNSILIIVI
jgi:hypothetical protein